MQNSAGTQQAKRHALTECTVFSVPTRTTVVIPSLALAPSAPFHIRASVLLGFRGKTEWYYWRERKGTAASGEGLREGEAQSVQGGERSRRGDDFRRAHSRRNTRKDGRSMPDQTDRRKGGRCQFQFYRVSSLKTFSVPFYGRKAKDSPKHISPSRSNSILKGIPSRFRAQT